MNNIDYLPLHLMTLSEKITELFGADKKFKEITFQITEDCCMACTYCYQHHKTNNKMTFDIAKKIIDKLLNNELEFCTTNEYFAINIDFIGGEPLMEIDLIEQIIEYTLTQMVKLQHPWLEHIRFDMNSNGLLYNTPKVQEIFKKYHDFIGLSISLDGNKELHDKCRIDLEGQGTYDRVINNIKLYEQQYGKLPTTKMTLSPNNISYTYDALINLIDLGYFDAPFNCVFEKGWDFSHAKIYYKELKKVADYLIDNNLYNKINIKRFNENWYQFVENDNQNWCGGTDTKGAAFDYHGDIYPCLRYMESSLNGKQKPLILGNINTGSLVTKEEKENYNLLSNITRRSQSTDECFYCPIGAGCAWCSGFNYEEFGTPNKRATYICCMHKAESLANVYYWNKLYQYLGIDKKFKS